MSEALDIHATGHDADHDVEGSRALPCCVVGGALKVPLQSLAQKTADLPGPEAWMWGDWSHWKGFHPRLPPRELVDDRGLSHWVVAAVLLLQCRERGADDTGNDGARDVGLGHGADHNVEAPHYLVTEELFTCCASSAEESEGVAGRLGPPGGVSFWPRLPLGAEDGGPAPLWLLTRYWRPEVRQARRYMPWTVGPPSPGQWLARLFSGNRPLRRLVLVWCRRVLTCARRRVRGFFQELLGPFQPLLALPSPVV